MQPSIYSSMRLTPVHKRVFTSPHKPAEIVKFSPWQMMKGRFRLAGVDPRREEIPFERDTPALGYSFCLTGTLTLQRTDIEDSIKFAGGKAASSVSRNTDYVVVGLDAGSKYDRALRLVVKE